MEEKDEGIWIPLEERERNEVDQLKATIREIQTEIEGIQAHCDHNFKLIDPPPELGETLVPGKYVGKTKGPVKGSIEVPQTQMVLICTKCSKRKETTIWETCPRCLSPMKKSRCLGAGSREKYFGMEYSYYSVTPYYCPECGLTVMCDTWDR